MLEWLFGCFDFDFDLPDCLVRCLLFVFLFRVDYMFYLLMLIDAGYYSVLGFLCG